MSRRTTTFLKAGLSAIHYTRLDALLEPWSRGDGAIFMLHQVTATPPPAFSPNRILQVTPAFLERTIDQVRARGFDIVSMDEVGRRMSAPDGRRFVAFTLDDAYRDNLTEAYPVFRRHGVPFTIYAPTDYLDGNGDLWWIALERAIARLDTFTTTIGGRRADWLARTVAEKLRAFHCVYWAMRGIDEAEARAEVARLCTVAGIDQTALCRELVMGWDELRQLAQDPLVTIGAHTRRHFAIARLPAATARAEMSESRARIERETGLSCRHFSFPFGDETSAGPREFALAAELGFDTAVTTRKGMIRAGSGLGTSAIPRISLNGDYQSEHYVKVLLSGVPFALLDLARRLVRRPIPA